MGGLGRPVAPVVGSPTHPVMPNLVMLWKMSPLRGGVRAGAGLWARGPARRGTGPEPVAFFRPHFRGWAAPR